MRIAIDCRLWRFTTAGECFLGTGIVPALIASGGIHQFFLIFDDKPPGAAALPVNATVLVLKPVADNAATRALWYDLRLPALLSGHNIDLFIGTAGYISLRSPVKQMLLLHDVLHGDKGPDGSGWGGSWYRRRLPAMMQKAAATLVPTHAHAALLAKTGDARVHILAGCPFLPASIAPDAAAQEHVKQRITDGCEFFFCREGWQTLDDAQELLLAFAAFKKRQMTGMKLVLCGTPPPEKSWPDKLATFRYCSDVVVLPPNTAPEAETTLLSAAWALIHLPAGSNIKPMLQALCLGVPVIAWPQPVLQEIAGAAALYCTDAPGESLPQLMMRMYKDEKMRNHLIATAVTLSQNRTPDRTARHILDICGA